MYLSFVLLFGNFIRATFRALCRFRVLCFRTLCFCYVIVLGLNAMTKSISIGKMDEYLKFRIHHSGEFIDLELSVYEGGLVDDLKIDVDKQSYFELVGVLKELFYSNFETIYYKDPTLEMNALVDGKSALGIVYLYKMHLSVNIYIQRTFSLPDYLMMLLIMSMRGMVTL